MNKFKISFIALLIINIVVIAFVLINSYIHKFEGINVKDGNLDEYSYMIDGEVPVSGYVPDGNVAVRIARAVLENTYIKPGLGYTYEVMYDKKNEAWIVSSSNLISGAAYIVISKKDGRIIKAWEAKR